MYRLRTSEILLFLSIIFLVRCDENHNASPICESCSIKVYTHDVTVKLFEIKQFNIEVMNFNKSNVTLHFLVQQGGIVKIVPESITLEPGSKTYEISVEATGAGISDVHANSSDPDTNVDEVYFIVTVYRNKIIDSISSIVGWIYFGAGALSFYPQILVNYQRKSVVGLNFDFLALNVLGFALYSIFNLGLYLIPAVEDEYLKRYPRGLNPVQENDIYTAVHATFATLVTIFQCYIYESGGQKVSTASKAILSIFGIFLSSSLILSAMSSMNWLDFLYICSYIKLVITLIKYVPQAFMNYKRKSTVGWSIGTVFLDFTAGLFSILQMLLNAFNYDDWASMFGDATKMGLGIFSVLYDIVFVIQHYILYNHKRQTYKLSKK